MPISNHLLAKVWLSATIFLVILLSTTAVFSQTTRTTRVIYTRPRSATFSAGNATVRANVGGVLGVDLNVATGSVTDANNAADAGVASFESAALLTANLTNTSSAIRSGLKADVGAAVNVTAATNISPVSLKVSMAETIKKGNTAGVVIGNSGLLLDVAALNQVSIRTYRNQTLVQTVPLRQLLGFGTNQLTTLGQNVPLLNNEPTRATFVAAGDFDQLEIVLGGALNLSYGLRFYYAFGFDDQNAIIQYKGALSNNATARAGQEYSTKSADPNGLVCLEVNPNITNPEFAANASLRDSATIRSLASVSASCPATLRVKLANTVGPTGYRAGFVVGNGGLLDLSLLNRLQLSTYLNNTLQEQSGINSSLLRVNLLPNSNNKYFVSFPTNKPFNQVEIKLNGVVSALDNLNIFYGFGIEESAFSDPNPVFSDFENSTGNFRTAVVQNNTGLLNLVACASLVGNGSCNQGIRNPQEACDRDLVMDYAEVKGALLDLNVNRGLALALKLNGAGKVASGSAGKAGSRAGVVVSYSDNAGLVGGLLNAGVLSNYTLTTYREVVSNGTSRLVPLESATGANLAQVGLLGGDSGKIALSFATTQDFDWVELTTTNTLSVVQDTRLYHAFAQEQRGFFPQALVAPSNPLPVELVAFTARVSGQGVEIEWKTASERNNNYFAVERAVRPGEYQEVGRLAGHGSSLQPHVYSLFDATAATQGAKTVYYRLRQVDHDGTESFSPISTVVFTGEALAASLRVWPNPSSSSGAVHVQTVGEVAGQTLLVYNMQGRLVHTVSFTEQTTEIVASSLGEGLYQLVLVNGAGQHIASQRLVVAGR